MRPVVLGHQVKERGDRGRVDVSMDLKRLLVTRLLVVGNSGSGKSWAIRRIAEQTHGQVQQIIIDPQSEFTTLREKYDYVLVGDGGDVPATVGSARLLARRLMEARASAILSIYELSADERVEFVGEFLHGLNNLPRELWHAVLVFLDEAEIFAPEKGAGEAESLLEVVDLATRGRKKGYCLIPAPQRVAALSKRVIAECNNRLTGRAGLDNDITRAAGTIGMSKAQAEKVLPGLDPGTFFAYGPAISNRVLLCKMGSVATTHPEPGTEAPPPPPPRESIMAILGQLGDVPAAAAKEEEELVALRREVGQLRLKVRERVPVERREEKPDQALLLAAREQGRRVGFLEGERSVRSAKGALLAAGKAIGQAADKALAAVQAVRGGADHLERAMESAFARSVQPVEVPVPAETATAPPTDRATLRFVDAPLAAKTVRRDLRMSGAQQAVLDAVRWLNVYGLEHPSRELVALVAGTSASSSHFERNCGWLRNGGWLAYAKPGCLALVVGGVANEPAEPPDALQLHEVLKRELPKNQGDLVRVLLAAYPDALHRQTAAKQAGTSAASSHFERACGRLKTLGLITYPQPATLRASDDLFQIRS